MPTSKSTVYGLQTTANSKKGFTLVEMMVVISIIAILSAIGLTVYTQAQKAGRDAKRQSDIQEIQKALEQYYAINQTYPSTMSTLNSSYFPAGAVPTDPKGVSYTYTKCGTAEQYVLCTPASMMETCPSKNCNADGAA